MSEKRYEANIIRATAVEPANNLQTTSAPGVWSIDEVVELQKKDKWPTVGNVTTDVADVFSTYLYDGTGSALTINNGLDLNGEGGLVWTKRRDHAGNGHMLVDTARGGSSFIKSNAEDAANTSYTLINSFNSNGYTLSTNGWVNGSGDEVCSWTFRKAPKFCDVVTWTGNGATRNISHNLGSVPGMIIIKRTDSASGWVVYHRSVGATKYLRINTTAAEATYSLYFNDTEPTSSVFTVGSNGDVNGSSNTYVAYLFAHNNNDGEFGPTQDQDVIKCGSYTGNGSTTGPTVDLGFEPQWLLIKDISTAQENWQIFDQMRGMPVGGQPIHLYPNSNAAEGSVDNQFEITSTGFKLTSVSNRTNASGRTYIYMAIRRGPLATPTSATDVFAIDNQTASSAPFLTSNFAVDMVLRKDTAGGNSEVMSRLTQGKALLANSTGAEQSDSVAQFDFSDGCLDGTSTDTSRYGWMFKRAPGFFDVVCHTGDGTTNRAISHNLGQIPRFRLTKSRDSTTYSSWWAYYIDSGGTQTRATLSQSPFYSNTDVVSTATNIYPTSTVTNASGIDYVNYLFGEISGISKISTYTGNGGTSAIDVICGFSSGARFVLIKSTSESTNWVFYDSVRGIVSGNDPYLLLNTTDAEVTNTDYIDPLSSGFTVSTSAPTSGLVSLNANNVVYFFYAIA